MISSEVSFDYSEVSLHSSEEFFLTSVDIFYFPANYLEISSEEIGSIGMFGEIGVNYSFQRNIRQANYTGELFERFFCTFAVYIPFGACCRWQQSLLISRLQHTTYV